MIINIEYSYCETQLWKYIHNSNHFSWSCYLIFRCWFWSIAIDAVVRDMLAACPSHTTFSSSSLYFLESSFFIPWASPPKISGLLKLMLYKFLLTSTFDPAIEIYALLPGLLFLLEVLRQVFKCFVISDAKMFLLHTWQSWSSYFLLGSEIIFYYKFLFENRGLLSLNSSEYPFLGLKSSKTIVSTS